jgi:hypothetical protein
MELVAGATTSSCSACRPALAFSLHRARTSCIAFRG